MPALISSLLVPIKAMPIRCVRVCVGYLSLAIFLLFALDVNAILVGTTPHFRIVLLFHSIFNFLNDILMFEHRIWSVATFLRSRTCIYPLLLLI